MATRPYQIVVWGATGFTGRLVCEQIAKDYHGRVRWAMAGRDRRKLETVKEQLVKINPECENVPIILADSRDQASVLTMAKQTSVLVATAGPFTKYGSPVVAASVEAGTHYCDITGEIPWVKRMREQHHEQAVANGVKIVHCCGYDSIPADLGMLVAADHIKNQLGKTCGQVYNLIWHASGGFSGGTVASGKVISESTPPEELQRLLSDPYYLVQDVRRHGKDRPPPATPAYIPLAKAYLCPWVMENVNSRIVHLSNSLLPQPYGADFRFWEAKAVPGLVAAWVTAVVGFFTGLVFAVQPLWWLASRVLPKPGEGPTREAMMVKGFWKHEIIALTEEPSGTPPQVVRAEIADLKRDPGYWGTSRMILEAGLCLALQQEELAAAAMPAGGVLTPASALGMLLVERLRQAGLLLQITESPALGQAAGVGAPAAAGAQ